MKTISKVTCGNKQYQTVFGNLVEAINRRGISGEAGINIEETESGVIIRLTTNTPSGDGGPATPASNDPTPWKYTPDGELATWHPVQIMDDNCNRFTMWVWGGTPK